MIPQDVKLTLERALDDYDLDRDYLDMSAIARCPRYLYHVLVNGRIPLALQAARYCHEGYLHEFDVIQRLNKFSLTVMHAGLELVAPFDERFRGHIDGELLDLSEPVLLEIKSVNEEHYGQVVQTGRVPCEHYERVQCYMRYGDYARVFVVYKARQTGEVWVVEIERNDELGQRLEQKAKMILGAVDAGEAPRCECGKCR